ncbi:hypothetical protein ACFOD0_02305 [Shewanella intestini]|uniref:DUF2607 family protein n=1 Tax=Shewanella intestini TaxID=2017544 RepID=A0ABS5I1B7_9GAMM|nr:MULTISPECIES: hypothetical protein [Shewanella]MBR9727811.1 hypothetical protein [Shewanella intestini]MRG36196.1 hypothetical protein [Shewanella sp. XMDDZSB0408]
MQKNTLHQLRNAGLMLFGLWLIVLQSITLSHAAEHALEADHSHCLYSNVYHVQSAGSISNAAPITQFLLTEVTPPKQIYLQPLLIWQRNLQVRAPPF